MPRRSRRCAIRCICYIRPMRREKTTLTAMAMRTRMAKARSSSRHHRERIVYNLYFYYVLLVLLLLPIVLANILEISLPFLT